MHTYQAALLNVGCNPLIALIITIVVVGVIVWAALWLLGLATFIAEPFRTIAMQAVKVIAIIYVVLVALEIIFGIRILAGVAPMGCGG